MFRSFSVQNTPNVSPLVAVPGDIGNGPVIDGDWLEVYGLADSATGTFNVPAGFTPFSDGPLITTNDGGALFGGWKIASGESAGWQPTSTGGGGTIIALALAFSGRAPAGPTDQKGITSVHTATASPWPLTSGIITAGAGDDLVFVGISDVTSGGTVAHDPPAGFTIPSGFSWTNGAFLNGMFAYLENAAGGSVGPLVGTGTLSGKTAANAVFLTAIPALGGGASTAQRSTPTRIAQRPSYAFAA